MIVRIHSRGSSFKGLTTYLTHDADAETSERVGWTHTLNCANDHVPSAVNEMLWTARDAELLKQEAGIRAGGRASENPNKHLSLNWAPDENPTREHMIATTEDFLRHMRWEDHQALLVAHTDKSYAHVHVMLNTIHPETGLKLDDNFERRRAQEWANDYEREHGGIRCENRLKNIGERELAPTRPAWQAFQGVRQDFEQQEQQRAAAADREFSGPNPELNKSAQEWEILKKMQRDERMSFFAEGKNAFADMRSAVFREVREEFRPRWADYYSAKRDGADPDILKELKATLVNEQKIMLEERRDSAYGELRETRQALYKDLLAGQRERREGLRARQGLQLESLDFMDSFRTDIRGARNDNNRAAADQTWEKAPHYPEREAPSASIHGINSMRSGEDAGARAADGFATAVLKVFDFLADSFCPSFPEPQRAPPDPVDDLFAQAAEDARQRQEADRDRQNAQRKEEEEDLAARRSRSLQ